MRDPSLAQGPDGTFHLVWTTGWGQPPVIGVAHSKDLIRWSEQKAVPVMNHEPTARNAWAPELFYDDAQRRWLIFWSSTIPGRFPDTDQSGDQDYNHRIYFTATTDFETFTPTRLFYDGGFNVIDATLLKADGKFRLIVKDETKVPVKKNLRIALGDHADGPFGPAGPPITGDWVEGPSAIQIGGQFYIYFDHYAKPQYYGATRSGDLVHWQDVSAQVSFPKGTRHGTVLRVAESVVQSIQQQTSKP
jgi:beta-xylosidase